MLRSKNHLNLLKSKLKNFEKFLEDNINVLFGSKNLPIATLVAMERRTPAANRIFTGEPTRLTTQAQIDKAIDEGDFYVENEKQGPSKYPRKKPTIEEVKNFFFNVGASTKGTRKDGLVNAISFSLFRDIVPSVMNKADIVQEDIAKVSAKLVVDPTIKFSKTSVENAKNVFMEDQSFKKNPTEFAAENKNWKAILKSIGQVALDPKNENDVVEFKKFIKDILSLRLPKEFFTVGTFANAGISGPKRGFFFTSISDLETLIEGVEFAKSDII